MYIRLCIYFSNSAIIRRKQDMPWRGIWVFHACSNVNLDGQNPHMVFHICSHVHAECPHCWFLLISNHLLQPKFTRSPWSQIRCDAAGPPAGVPRHLQETGHKDTHGVTDKQTNEKSLRVTLGKTEPSRIALGSVFTSARLNGLRFVSHWWAGSEPSSNWLVLVTEPTQIHLLLS